MGFLYDRLPEYTKHVVDNRTDINIYGNEVKLLEQYLSIIDEEIFDFYKDQIEKIQYFSDIDLIDDDYLSYLSFILGYIWDNKKSYQIQRDYLKKIVDFYKRKGTIFSIHYSLSLEDKDVEIIETYPWIFTLNKSKLNSDHRLPSRYYYSRGIFVVRTTMDLDKARDIVEENRPAGTLPIYEFFDSSVENPNGLDTPIMETDESAILYHQLIRKHQRPEYDAFYYFDLLVQRNATPYYEQYFNIMRRFFDFYEPELYDQKWHKKEIVKVNDHYNYTAYYFDYFQFADLEIQHVDNIAYEDFSGYFIIHNHEKDYERDPIQYFNNGINLVSSRKGLGSTTEIESETSHYLGQTLYVDSYWRLCDIYSHHLDKNENDMTENALENNRGKICSKDNLSGDFNHHNQGFDKNYLQRLDSYISEKWGFVTDWFKCKLGKRYLLGNRSPFSVSSGGSIGPGSPSSDNLNATECLVGNYNFSWSDTTHLFGSKLNEMGILPKTYVHGGVTYTFNEIEDEDYKYELISGDKVITFHKQKLISDWTFDRFEYFNKSFYPNYDFSLYNQNIYLLDELNYITINKTLTATELLDAQLDIHYDIIGNENKSVSVKINNIDIDSSEYSIIKDPDNEEKSIIKFVHSNNINDKLNIIIQDTMISTTRPLLFGNDEDSLIKVNSEYIRVERAPAAQESNNIYFTNLITNERTKVTPPRLVISNESFITDEFNIEGYKCKIHAFIDNTFIYSVNVWFDGKFAKNQIDNEETDTLMTIEQILPNGLRVTLVDYNLQFYISSQNFYKTKILDRNVKILGYKLPEIPEKHPLNIKIGKPNYQLIEDRMLYMYRNLLDTVIETI